MDKENNKARDDILRMEKKQNQRNYHLKQSDRLYGHLVDLQREKNKAYWIQKMMDPDYQLQRDLFDDEEIKLEEDQLRTMNKSHGNEWNVGRDDEIRLNSINIFK